MRSEGRDRWTQRFLSLSFSTSPPLPLSLSFSPFLCSACSLHQDAIIQDISEEELKALTVEEGPRVLSESADADTHAHTHTHTHFEYRSTIQHR